MAPWIWLIAEDPGLSLAVGLNLHYYGIRPVRALNGLNEALLTAETEPLPALTVCAFFPLTKSGEIVEQVRTLKRAVPGPVILLHHPERFTESQRTTLESLGVVRMLEAPINRDRALAQAIGEVLDT